MVTLLVGAMIIVAAPTTSAKPAAKPLTAGEQQALRAGLQVAPKGRGIKSKFSLAQPNPYLANVVDVRKVDYSVWNRRLGVKGDLRAASAKTKAAKVKAAGHALAAAVVHDEEEPAGTLGANDSQPNAELITGFGTGAGRNARVRVLGQLTDLTPSPSVLAPGKEDDGQLDRAVDTKISDFGSVRTTGVLGDGPHGKNGDASNDFDFYTLTSVAGSTITLDTSEASTAPTDTVVAVYDAAGKLLASDDDGGTSPASSRLAFKVPTDGRYYALVAGFSGSPFPADPNDSGSGTGGAAQGPYRLTVSSAPADLDYFAMDLKQGDVVGATVTGTANKLTMYRIDGTQMVGNRGVDASALYPPQSPLPGGGNATLAYVTEESGRYAIEVDGRPGLYDATVEAYRPGSEIDRSRRIQTLFLDFDGERVNTGIWGGPGVRTLSPFSSFISSWGISRSEEASLVKKITAGVRENVQKDLIKRGLNKNLAVRVISSRNHADPFGAANVSRVIVGGTSQQSGISTIGISQFIDPGNYGHEDSALVLLDIVSGPAAGEASLNHYLKPSSNRVAFVSRAMSNVISHEVGHLIGNYHTDNMDPQHSLMDAGGVGFANLYGTGPDLVGGTADDEDVDFTVDTYSPTEPFTGKENTLNVSAWAYVRGSRVAQP
ncbi:MAG: hypothetical protein QOF52_2193 [Propionibacteriaceae bacterium]|jgi:hypothetical protein|nr:hypothetical protein [Propionibacteriaceae bacterium]